MATNELNTKAAVCDAALALLRQDIGYTTSASITAKCDSVWTLAYDTLANAHEWREGLTVGDTVPTSSMLRHLLVYALARELAIPVTGRQEDLKTIDAQWEKKLTDAIAKDLQSELDELRAQDDDDSKLAVEILDISRQYWSSGDEKNAYGNTKGFPRSIASLVRHINSVKETVRKEVIMSHDWSFATADAPAHSLPAPDRSMRFCTPVPADAVKVIKCFSDIGEKTETVMRGGMLVSRIPIRNIVYLFDCTDLSEWTLLAKRAFLYKMTEVLALANPEIFGNPDRVRQLTQSAQAAIQEARTADARQTHLGTSAYGRNYLLDVATGKRPPKWAGEWMGHNTPYTGRGFRRG